MANLAHWLKLLRSRRAPVALGREPARRRSRPALERLEGRVVPSFLAPLAFDAGYSPRSVAAGDFNGDGVLDLAVANALSNNVSVLLGTGDGGFGDARNFSAGSGPNSVAVGDVNGDGRLDLAASGYDCQFGYGYCGDETVRVLLGNGDGTFQAARYFRAGSMPRSVAVGHFDGDGVLDLAVANNIRSGTVSVLLGTGDGGFGDARNFSAGGGPRSVAVGDLNGDGLLDLAAAGYGYSADCFDNTVRVLLGNGDGTFAAAQHFSAGICPQSVAVGDFDGDGVLDLAVANGRVSVLLGTGDGGFGDARNFSAGGGPRSVATGDFNGDGWPDLVTANSGSNNVSILENAADDVAFFYLDAPAQVVAGQPFDLTLYALSGIGRLAHGYRGTFTFWSSDPEARLPANFTFTAADWGYHTFAGETQLATLGAQYLWAWDTATGVVVETVITVVSGGAPGAPGGQPRPGGAEAAAAELLFSLTPRRLWSDEFWTAWCSELLRWGGEQP